MALHLICPLQSASSVQQNTQTSSESVFFVGELSLSGKLRPIRGALSIAIMAAQRNIEYLILPKDNATEAACIKGLQIISAEDIQEVIRWLQNR